MSDTSEYGRDWTQEIDLFEIELAGNKTVEDGFTWLSRVVFNHATLTMSPDVLGEFYARLLILFENREKSRQLEAVSVLAGEETNTLTVSCGVTATSRELAFATVLSPILGVAIYTPANIFGGPFDVAAMHLGSVKELSDESSENPLSTFPYEVTTQARSYAQNFPDITIPQLRGTLPL